LKGFNKGKNANTRIETNPGIEPDHSEDPIVADYSIWDCGDDLWDIRNHRVTGIAGFIMAREIAWFGSASFALSYCLDLVVIFVPSIVLAFLLGVTIFPSLSEALLGIFVAKPKPPDTAPALSPLASGGMTWMGIGKAMLVMFGLTGAVGAVLYFLNVREQSLGVFQLNLDTAQSALRDRLGFIQVTGHAVQKLALTYSDQRTVSLVLPVTSGTWTSAEPLRVFVRYHQLGDSRTQLTPPSEFRARQAATFDGETEGKLPAFVEQAYTAKGLKLDPDYKVVAWQRLTPGEMPMSNSHMIALGIGGLISVSLSLILILTKLKGSGNKKAAMAAAG